MHVHIDRVFTTVARNLGLKDFSRYTNNWIEWSYEAEKLIGSRDTFVQKETTYTSTGAKASGRIDFAAQPSSGDSVTFNGVEIFFRTTQAGASNNVARETGPNNIRIGSTLSNTLVGGSVSLEYALRGNLFLLGGDAVSQTAIANYPELLNTVTYEFFGSDGYLTITSKEVGDKGNYYTLGSNNTNISISGQTLTGGKGVYRNQQLTLPDNMVKLLGVRVGTDDSDYEHVELRRTSAVHRGRVGKTTDDSQQRAFR